MTFLINSERVLDPAPGGLTGMKAAQEDSGGTDLRREEEATIAAFLLSWQECGGHAR